MDKIIGIEIDGYGICLDSEWTYLALSWKLIATAVLVVIGYKIYKKRFYKFK